MEKGHLFGTKETVKKGLQLKYLNDGFASSKHVFHFKRH